VQRPQVALGEPHVVFRDDLTARNRRAVTTTWPGRSMLRGTKRLQGTVPSQRTPMLWRVAARLPVPR